ncbi:hypothetical protein CDV36_014638 [Fusarium kuroshium]|uniref:Protein kinase domain-containing protein n=1 Tax=Fusarium kuroshium TaxID=2010991 RepID=A0A3M2RIJ1_9HYPO|nr:hypothetical protein CDV36_014638 [Fusarium kuroshium]
MLNELKALNDGLQKLLPKGDVDTICQSLAGEIINADMKLESLTDDELGEMGLKVAKTIELRRVNTTSVLAQSAFSKVQYGDDGGEETSPYFIPTSCFAGFTELRIKQGMPISRHIYDYQSPEASRQKEVVLVEWRSADAESKHSTITREELTSRRSHVVSLLHRTAVSDHDYRVLNCLGFCLATARMSDGDTERVVGFVYQLPTHAASHIMPVSLREIIGDAFVSPEPSIPSLDDRYQLARTLAVCLYHLQCAGWIHRKISSYNILFFKDGASGKVDITRPYLAGWQYARPDGEDFPLAAIHFKSEGYALGSISLGDFGMYIHPSRWVDEWDPAHDSQASKLPPFQKVHDIYSFGVVLVEIAFWEPIFALVSSQKREKMKALEVCEEGDNIGWPLNIRATAEKELASEMGVSYRNAVLNCLQGLDNVEDGVEKQFFWQVVNKLKYTCIKE